MKVPAATLVRLLASVAIIGASVVYVASPYFSGPAPLDLFLSPSELRAHSAEIHDGVFVAGIVGTSTSYTDGSTQITHLELLEPASVDSLVRNTGEVKVEAPPLVVSYRGLLPPLFRKGRAVMLRGVLVGDAFEAGFISTRCGDYERSDPNPSATPRSK